MWAFIYVQNMKSIKLYIMFQNFSTIFSLTNNILDRIILLFFWDLSFKKCAIALNQYIKKNIYF